MVAQGRVMESRSRESSIWIDADTGEDRGTDSLAQAWLRQFHIWPPAQCRVVGTSWPL